MEKIIVFTPSLNIGGIERILLTYAKGLASHGHKVTYLTLSKQGDFEIKDSENLVFECLGVNRLRKALFKLVNFFKHYKPDVILCANEATMMVYLGKLLSGISTKIITSQHNYYENYLDMNFKMTFVPKYIFPRCFKVIAVSEGIRSMLIQDFKINPKKIVTISNPIDIFQVQEQGNQMVNDLPKEYILFVGRFDKVKNISLLLDSYFLFIKKFPVVKLLLIGGGSELNNIENKIRELNLGEFVEILGVKPNPFPYIKGAKIVVLSSISEAFPTVLLESITLGTTTVSTPTNGGNDILVKGKFGYLSESIYNEVDLYKKLVTAYLQPIDKNLLIDYAQSNYNLDSKVVEIEKLWKIG